MWRNSLIIILNVNVVDVFDKKKKRTRKNGNVLKNYKDSVGYVSTTKNFLQVLRCSCVSWRFSMPTIHVHILTNLSCPVFLYCSVLYLHFVRFFQLVFHFTLSFFALEVIFPYTSPLLFSPATSLCLRFRFLIYFLINHVLPFVSSCSFTLVYTQRVQSILYTNAFTDIHSRTPFLPVIRLVWKHANQM